MILFIIIAILAITACMPSGKREKPKAKTIKPAAYKPDPQYRQLQAEIKLRQQQRRKEEKAWKQAEKEKLQAEKEKQKRESALFDIEFLQDRLVLIDDMIESNENEINNVLSEIENSIEKQNRIKRIETAKAGEDLQQLANEMEIDDLFNPDNMLLKHQKRYDQLLKRKISLETQKHNVEKKLLKCYYTINS